MVMSTDAASCGDERIGERIVEVEQREGFIGGDGAAGDHAVGKGVKVHG